MVLPATLRVYTFVKFFEVVLLCIGTGVCCSSYQWMISKTREQSYVLAENTVTLIMAGVCTLIVILNLFYQNILINLRFFVKMKSVTCGLCVFDAVNVCCCYFCFKHCCRHRYNQKLTWATWIFKLILFIFTAVRITDL